MDADRICYDSSCWIALIEHDDAKSQLDEARTTAGATGPIVVPATVLAEVRRWMLRRDIAELHMDAICRSLEELDFVAMDATIAGRTADTAVTSGLAFADASILATARYRFATLLTYDRDFEGVPGALVLDPPPGAVSST